MNHAGSALQTLTDKLVAKKEGGIGWIIFNNPARHNAVSFEMWQSIPMVLDAYAKDPEVRVIILKGAGEKAFVAGADISQFKEKRTGEDAVREYNAASDKASEALRECPKPTIAMIRGYCIGGGLGLAVSCDIRIATDLARFAMPAARLGLGYDLAGMRRFVQVLGPSFTKEMFYTARQFDAAEARAMGLVNRTISDGEIENFTRDYAETIAANAPLTIAAVKFIVGELQKEESGRNLERCTELVERCFASRDYEEGRRAFMEKRRPAFTGT